MTLDRAGRVQGARERTGEPLARAPEPATCKHETDPDPPASGLKNQKGGVHVLKALSISSIMAVPNRQEAQSSRRRRGASWRDRSRGCLGARRWRRECGGTRMVTGARAGSSAPRRCAVSSMKGLWCARWSVQRAAAIIWRDSASRSSKATCATAIPWRAALDGVGPPVPCLAADYRRGCAYPAELFLTNVEGTRMLMEEALSAGTERIVYTSSVATLKNEAGRAAGMRGRPPQGGRRDRRDKRNKIRAEARARDGRVRAARGDREPVHSGRPPRAAVRRRPAASSIEAARGRLPAYVETGLNMVSVGDVAKGHLAALRRGRAARPDRSAGRTSCSLTCWW